MKSNVNHLYIPGTKEYIMKYLIFSIGIITNMASIAQAQEFIGKTEFLVSPMAPPQFTIHGDAAKAIYDYIRSEVRDAPYYIPRGSVKVKSAHSTNCRYSVSYKEYTCELLFDSAGFMRSN
jgi:hypothetical protein